ncbi:GumC family protein [Aridibaculum aurantiacum]|uniref:GumC family protein n=1 Tax=Aridibaculum aurantiacum TaxID=2810307 RepID=UPI001A96BFBF|nr:tyrosine-protein kinase [Aridibaculum aurantiacum]
MQTNQLSPFSQEYKPKEEEGLSELVEKYLPWWPLFVALMLLGGICAYIYLRYTIPVYEVTANLLVKDEKKGINSADIMESLDLFGSKKIVENEIEVLKSRTLMKEVVQNLHLYAPVMEEGRVKDVSGYLASPVLVQVKDPAHINGIIKEYFYVKNGKVVLDSKEYNLDTWIVVDSDTIRFVKNPNYRQSKEDKPFYFSLVDVKRVVNSYASALIVSPTSKQATVINLKLKDPIPKRGEDVLNELIQVYNRAAIEDKNKLAANTLAFVEERLHFVVNELDSVEGAIQRYKTQKGIVNISEQGRLFLESVESNDQKVAEMNMQLAVLDQVEQYVRSKAGAAGVVPSTLGVNDPVLSQLLQRLYELEVQYEKLKKTTAEGNYVLVSVQDQIEKVKPSILENIQNQRRSLNAGRNNLTGVSNQYASVLKTLPQKERELLEISRQQSIKNNIYTFLLQKREETALSFASTVADSRIVDVAEASLAPISPKRSVVYLGAIAAGLVIGIGFISFKEIINRNVLFRNDIVKYLSWPIIGEVAHDLKGQEIVIGNGERHVIAEQFRQIRSSLAYLGINQHRKTILITSTISGEGKTFIAANLATSLALTDKKVVLLELDLRKPKLSPLFKADSTIGISSYLVGAVGMGEIIQRTDVNENLFFISSGPIPPNPSELILNGRMSELLTFLEQEFDYILIDTAPIAPVTDASILTKLCHTTLYVVRHGYTPKSILKKLDENKNVTGLKNPAVIFNGLKSRGFQKYGYGYGYGYSYGYGYGNDIQGSKNKTLLQKILSFFTL